MDDQVELSVGATNLMARLKAIENALDPRATAIDYAPLDKVLNTVLDALFLGAMTHREADAITREAGYVQMRMRARLRKN